MQPKHLILTLVLVINATFAFTQNSKPYRQAFRFVLYVDSAKYYAQEIDSTPYFGNNNSLQLYTGEQVFVEVETKNKTILSMKVVEKNEYPEKTLIITTDQKSTISKSEYISLNITNPFKYGINTSISEYSIGKNDWVEMPNTFIKQKETTSFKTEDLVVTFLIENWSFK